MSARDWRSWRLPLVSFAALNGLVVGTAIVILIRVMPPIDNTLHAAARHEAPASTALTTRSRRSFEQARPILCWPPVQQAW